MTGTDRYNRVPYTCLRPFRHGLAHQFICFENCDYIGAALKRYGEYSEGEVDIFRTFVRESDIVIDAGALYGVHTIALASLCPLGMVFAFEPQRVPFQMLCGNVQLNSMWNVEASRVALGAAESIAWLTPLSPYDLSPWGLTRTYATKAAAENQAIGREPVRVRSIDSLGGLPRLDFLKLDVEGSEAAVLRGAADTIRRFYPVIYLEFNENRETLLEILRGFDYKSIWRHLVPVAREPNYLGAPVERVGAMPRPSDMLLAVPDARIPAMSRPGAPVRPGGDLIDIRDWERG